MNQALINSVAAIARHACRTTHWVKTAKGPRHVKEPLKFPHLERHVDSGPAVGVSPIAPGSDTTRIAVLDFDSHKGEVDWATMCKTAHGVSRHLHTLGIVPIPFRSTGGRGVHLICIWDEPQDAYSVRLTFSEVLAACSLKPGTKGVKHAEVEIFPKQDAVPVDGFGSMFILPLAGQSVPLDPPTLEPLPMEYAESTTWPASKAIVTRPRPTVDTYSKMAVPSLGTHLAEVRSALLAIPNDGDESLDYDSWRNVIFALHHASEGSADGLALAHEFSSRSSKYDPAFLDERVWPHIRSERLGKVITARSLFDRARRYGWIEPVELDFPDLSTEAAEPNSGPISPDSSTTVPNGTPAKRFRVITASEFLRRPRPRWIVRNVLPEAELVLIIGQSGAGKSFLALDIVAAVALGLAWRGHTTRAGRVVYVCAEGAGGFRNRLEAYCRHHNVSIDQLPVGIIADTPNLIQKDDVRAVIEQLKAFGKVDIIVIDTFAQATAGGDENSGEDVGRALGHCKAIHRATGAVVLLVHHLGKDASKGARGWSGLKAAADAEIEVTRLENERIASITKMKDGEDGTEFPFKLVQVPIGADEEGEVIDSCVVEHVSEKSSPRREPSGRLQKLVLQAAHDVADITGGAVSVDAVVTEAVTREPRGEGPKDKRREHVRRALASLASDRFVEIRSDQVYLANAQNYATS